MNECKPLACARSRPYKVSEVLSSASILALAVLLLVVPGYHVSAQGAARVAPRGNSARAAPAAPPLTPQLRPSAELRPNATDGAFRMIDGKRRRSAMLVY